MASLSVTLLPRSSSNSSISALSWQPSSSSSSSSSSSPSPPPPPPPLPLPPPPPLSSLTTTTTATTTSSASSLGLRKIHQAKPSDFSCFSFRLHRVFSTRRSVGMLSATLICVFSFVMLINIASRVSIHFTTRSEKETVLELINVERIRSLHSDANSSDRIGNQSSRLLSEEITLRANTMHFIRNPRLDNHKNMTISSYMSSDQPLPPDHLCHGFTLPPPPSDKKRTGPRPCPVCYLPIEDAIKKMPSTNEFTMPVIRRLSYAVDVAGSRTGIGLMGSEFGGYPTLEERRKSFEIQEDMKVYCGFTKGVKPGLGTGFDIDEADLLDMEKCRGIVVASAIFGNYDLLQQPRNISPQSRKSVCFFMFIDEETHKSLYSVESDQNILENGIWRVVLVHNMPYLDARRNGKIPKLLLHRLFPNAKYSLWIDGKLELVVDPIQVLERFLWRRNRTFAISQHYRRFDVFSEAEANKAAGKYSNASIDAQIDFYKTEGIKHFNPSTSPFPSDVPEGCVIIREHNLITNLFTCLWFNEVDRFTSRDQLSFAIVRNKLTEKVDWGFSMFLDCERRNFVVQTYHKDLLAMRKAQQQSVVRTNTISSSYSNVMSRTPPKLQEMIFSNGQQT